MDNSQPKQSSGQSIPKAVLISDIHYNINNLSLADASLRQATSLSVSLGVPLIVAGDLHDTKAIIRGECLTAIMHTLAVGPTRRVVMPGNHCMLNSKGKEHSLEFLTDRCEVVDKVKYDKDLNVWIIPYHNDSDELCAALKSIPPGSTIIMHQGLLGADMGGYVQDKTSLSKELFKDFRVISGHYHKRQHIECGPVRIGNVGLFSYIGSPYTQSFGEANDGPKGFQMLMDDGTLQFVPTNLRKHVILQLTTQELCDPTYFIRAEHPLFYVRPEDLVWLKVSGPTSELQSLKKEAIGQSLFGHSNYKLEKIYPDAPKLDIKIENFTQAEILDKLIDGTSEAEERKSSLKKLWRVLV